MVYINLTKLVLGAKNNDERNTPQDQINKKPIKHEIHLNPQYSVQNM